MNDHPRQIWKAWLDGQTVQCLADGEWKDAEPNHYPRIQQPQCLEGYWRIKSDVTAFIEVGRELLEDLESRYYETLCGCGHPACKSCRGDEETAKLLARAKGKGIKK